MLTRRIFSLFALGIAAPLVALSSTLNLGTYVISEIPYEAQENPGFEDIPTTYFARHTLLTDGGDTVPPYALNGVSFAISQVSEVFLRMEAPAGQLFSLNIPTGGSLAVGGQFRLIVEGYTRNFDTDIYGLFPSGTVDFVGASVALPEVDYFFGGPTGNNREYFRPNFGGDSNLYGDVSFQFSAIEVRIDFDAATYNSEVGFDATQLDYLYDFGTEFTITGFSSGIPTGPVLSLVPIPEPHSYAVIMSLAALGLVVLRRKRR